MSDLKKKVGRKPKQVVVDPKVEALTKEVETLKNQVNHLVNERDAIKAVNILNLNTLQKLVKESTQDAMTNLIMMLEGGVEQLEMTDIIYHLHLIERMFIKAAKDFEKEV